MTPVFLTLVLLSPSSVASVHPLVRHERKSDAGTVKVEVSDSGSFRDFVVEHRRSPSAALLVVDASGHDDILDSSSQQVHRPSELKEVCVADPVGGPRLAEDPAFQRQAQTGHDVSASKSIVFAGLLRDIGSSSVQLMQTIRKAGSAFARYHIILLENNSGDNTRAWLETECDESKDVWCLELDLHNFDRAQAMGNPKRVFHFTLLRQSLLGQVRRFVSDEPAGSKWDYLVLFDGDMFAQNSGGFHPSMLDALLGFPNVNTWDVVCGNQLSNWPRAGRYRDTFALRRAEWQEDRLPNSDKSLYFTGNKLVPVKSCFSGLALYSMKAIMNSGCNYTFQGEDTCEHVPFHKCLAESGYDKVALYPLLTNSVNDRGVVHQSCVGIGEKATAAMILKGARATFFSPVGM